MVGHLVQLLLLDVLTMGMSADDEATCPEKPVPSPTPK